MTAGAPKNNKNAEKWTLEATLDLFNEAVELACKYDERTDTYQFDFLGEIAREQGTYIDLYNNLATKFNEVKPLYNQLKRNLEANCFSNGKKAKINSALAIMNLKSNYKWTDRVDNTTKGDKISNDVTVKFVDNSDESLS